MSMNILKSIVSRVNYLIPGNLPGIISKSIPYNLQPTSCFKMSVTNFSIFRSIIQPPANNILKNIQLPQLQPSCGFKVKGRLKRRCKDCFKVVRDGREYVICKTHPRHKQMAMKKKERTTWILTHATQSKVRPY